MALFGSKKSEEETNEQQSTSGAPVDMVLRMREQGLSNNQIIASLQRDGYKTTDIFDAMNQADLKRANGAPAEEGGMQNQIYPEELIDEPQQFEQQPSYQEPSYNNNNITRVEELVEAVIEEKWVDLVKDVNKITEWKSSVESDISSINQEIEDLKASFNELQKNIVSKIDEYDRNIVKVSTNIKAMENVFQKAIPTFTENINELARTVESLKNISKKRKK